MCPWIQSEAKLIKFIQIKNIIVFSSSFSFICSIQKANFNLILFDKLFRKKDVRLG